VFRVESVSGVPSRSGSLPCHTGCGVCGFVELTRCVGCGCGCALGWIRRNKLRPLSPPNQDAIWCGFGCRGTCCVGFAFGLVGLGLRVLTQRDAQCECNVECEYGGDGERLACSPLQLGQREDVRDGEGCHEELERIVFHWFVWG
jgi:hypothetical protein